ncbi:LuxR C-terminal-related transcriptional regulator [Nocardioides sp. CN2-186]|uniref:LuxR C-terminal-related transcriptional regulator n=1 Tax=Nocardioides tweenelious TaxID=3156607 RepID=UPI0032B39CEE
MANRVTTSALASAGHLPGLPRVYVRRERLWHRLEQAADSSVTLLVGPAGSGKTLGLSGWLHHSARAADTIWVQADATWDADRLLALLDRREEGTGRPALVVVDDAHLLPLTTVRDIDERLDLDPESFRLLLASRWDLPLTRLGPELLGHFTVLRGDILRLDDDESATLVAAHAHTDSVEVARSVARRAQGWCAAVVLTARAVGAAPDPLALAHSYDEGSSAVADRIATEVFAALQPHQRHLLLCVAGEPVLTPSLAVHLSHDVRAEETLAGLEATGLLVTRVAGGGPSPTDVVDPDPTDDRMLYSIHPLLTEVVRRRVLAGGEDVARAAATVGRAVRLDVARGEIDDALRRLAAVGDVRAAARLLADEGVTLLLRGHGAAVHAFATRYPSAIEVTPGSWFAVGLERWIAGEVCVAAQRLDRIVHDPQPDTGTAAIQLACARVMRSRLGVEPIPSAVAHAERVLADEELLAEAPALVPFLLCELAITQNWTGDLSGAEEHLAAAVRLSRTHDLPALTAIALSHLAFTEYMQGHEASAVSVADEVLDLIETRALSAPYSAGRARLARQLAQLSGLPGEQATVAAHGEIEVPLHAADLTTRYWVRARRSRLELCAGSVSAAELALESPLETPPLSAHLAAALIVERAFMASLSGDAVALAGFQEGLVELQAPAEAALVAGLRADLVGDRRAAVRCFAEVATHPAHPQPATKALALTAQAQLVDELGDGAAALELLRGAALATEVRRNAVPFLGWSRHGTPLAELMRRLADTGGSGWIREVADGIAGMTGISSYYGPSTALPRERDAIAAGTIKPTLSPRERDVLYELARGSTYADIAANLFVSENTVKTHVSSLYAKLSVNRRSAALAAARNMNLL